MASLKLKFRKLWQKEALNSSIIAYNVCEAPLYPCVRLVVAIKIQKRNGSRQEAAKQAKK